MNKKGDFLTGFSGGSTNKPLTEQSEAPVSGDKSTETKKTDVKKDIKTDVKKAETTKVNISNNKKLADQIVTENEKKAKARVGTATRPAQNASAIIKAPEHTITKDDKFHKRKMTQYGIIGTSSVVIIFVIFFLVRMVTRVEVRNFEGDELSEVNTWGVMNSITIEPTHEYSIEVPEGHIISQSHEPGTRIPSRSVFSVVVSDGPDMNEVVALPEDLEEMTRGEITTWRNDNGFTASSIAFSDEASTEVDANHVIRIEVPNDVDINNFTRSDRLNIVFSSGPQIIQMGNFMTAPGNTREAVETWQAANPGINVEIEDEPSDTVERDIVLGQSHAPQSNLEEGSTVTIRISAGSPVIVPNFADVLSEEEATELGQEIDLQVNIRNRFNTLIPKGRFVAQSREPGYELFGENPSVNVTYSLGPPWMESLSMENDIQEAMNRFRSGGAWVTSETVYVDSFQPRGTIVFQSLYNQYIAMDAHVVFHVSRGNLTPPAGASIQTPDDESGLENNPEDE